MKAIIALVVLVAAFSKLLRQLLGFAWNSDLYSHILLIPAVSSYLVWTRKPRFVGLSLPDRLVSVVLGLLGCLLAGAYFALMRSNPALALSAGTAGFVALFIAGVGVFCGREFLRQNAFAAFFLIFMIPIPEPLLDEVVRFLQVYSAAAASALFTASGITFLRQGTQFQLPGITLEVAPECSGIHSTLVLFITSMLAANLLLRSNWHRAVLTLVIIPLALLRNGFRIFVIGQLCANVSPDMIHSLIHKRGGPFFFVVSLVPFFLLLLFFRWSERSHRTLPEVRSGSGSS